MSAPTGEVTGKVIGEVAGPASEQQPARPAYAQATPQGTASAPRRLVALDAWRGITILLMLLVNNVSLGRFTPSQLVHARWGGGLTLTDLVFPWFLFCAGAALPFSLGNAPAAGWWPDRRTVLKLFQRAVPLYLVGALLSSVEIKAPTLGLGVLQLIALASLCAGLLARLPTRWRLGMALVLLVAYRLFLLSAPFSETDNAVQRLNILVLNDFGLRGLTSVIPATALVLLGSVAAQPLRNRLREWPLLLSLGAALSLVGWLAADALGFNKVVWTPAYILYSAGLGTLGMLALYLIGDTRRGRLAWLLSPLTVAGRNSLFAYVVPILIKLWILGVWQVNWTGKSQSILAALLSLAQQHLGAQAGGWLYTLGYVGAVWLVLWVLARRGFIWKL